MSHYQQSGWGRFQRPGFFGGFSFFPPVIKALLISNTAIWLLAGFLLGPFTIDGISIAGLITSVFALWPIDSSHFWPWQLFTYMFLHGGFGHLFMNMFALWMFGMELENLWGSKRFFIFYVICGLGGGIAHLLIGPFVGLGLPTVGASGAVFGVLAAFALLFPDRPIYIYFLFPIKAKILISAYIALELFYGVFGSQMNIAHFAHLGGAGVGVLYTLGVTGAIPFRSWWNDLTGGGLQNPFGSVPRVPYKKDEDVKEATFYDINTGEPKPKNEFRVTQEVIDQILDKISKGGYQSLTSEEKRILNEASGKIH